MPSTPTNRPIPSPYLAARGWRPEREHSLSASAPVKLDLGSHNAPDQRPWARRGLADRIAACDQVFGFRQFCVRIVMNCGESFALFHAVADALVEFQAHPGIDLVLFLLPPPAEHGQRNSKLLAVRPGDEAGASALNLAMPPRARQPLRLIHEAVAAAPQPDPGPDLLLRGPRGKKRFRQPAALLDRWGSFAKQKHPCRKLDAQLPQVRRPASAEHLQRFRNLVAVPRHSPQRLIHVRDQRDDL